MKGQSFVVNMNHGIKEDESRISWYDTELRLSLGDIFSQFFTACKDQIEKGYIELDVGILEHKDTICLQFMSPSM